jgi:predicted transcriptional regulator
MTRMVRKQICIDAELDRRLAAMAGSRRMSQSEIVRDALSAFFDHETVEHQKRSEAVERFMEQGEQIGKLLPPGWKPLTREEANARRHFR